MPTAVINQPDCNVRLHRERLEIYGRDENREEQLLREIPLRDLDRLIAVESTQLSSAAMTALLEASIPINFLAWNGRFLGGFLPATNTHGQARLRQYQRTLDATFALQMSGRIVSAKLYNQRRVLQRLQASRQDTEPGVDQTAEAVAAHQDTALPTRRDGAPPDANTEFEKQKSEIASSLAWLDSLLTSAARSQTLDELRGYEGVSTARYFQTWASFLPAEFPFERRSTRPPHNPVNACISFGATVLYSEAVAFLHAHGLDPSLGLLHATEDGRWSLALDLIEPFRPVLIEALALDLFSHQMLNRDHFEPRNGGVYLNESGRKKFFLQYERRMERQFMSECVGHRTSLRQQLEQQAVMYKAALEEPARFEPFLIN